MQVFLGDAITLMRQGEDPTMVTGQVSGVVLNDARQLERIYIHGIDVPFWIGTGWLIVDESEDDDGEI